MCKQFVRSLAIHQVIERVIERVMHAVQCLMYFVVVMLLFQLLAKHSSAALLCVMVSNLSTSA